MLCLRILIGNQSVSVEVHASGGKIICQFYRTDAHSSAVTEHSCERSISLDRTKELWWEIRWCKSGTINDRFGTRGLNILFLRPSCTHWKSLGATTILPWLLRY